MAQKKESRYKGGNTPSEGEVKSETSIFGCIFSRPY